MPTYEYECNQCGNRFEQFQTMSDAHLNTCPECGGKITRLIGSGGGFLFKGSGFYSVDYKNPSPRCNRDTPCCGRETPCETRPCGEK
ncbi:MAG: zinc ribbon domain-containing protein [Candidatus Omnitrophota bacterium]|nr:MAG: zinc ribbon domain-containing protein [Candidatus Omnitrophota bacterium]